VLAEVTRTDERAFSVTLTVAGPDIRRTVLRAKAFVALVGTSRTSDGRALSDDLAGLLATDIGSSADDRRDVPSHPDRPVSESLTSGDPSVLYWPWTARYLYCHYSDRVQHSAYIRALEEAVDRFLAERGLSIGSMLVDRGWIPVVSRARIQLITEAHMDETVHTTFSVESITKQIFYDARMDCYVRRDGGLVHTAMATITHGYIVADGQHAVHPVKFDETVMAALAGRSPQS
jgi:acyl-CoA thioesterase FadM